MTLFLASLLTKRPILSRRLNASAIQTGGISTGLAQEDLDIAASDPMDAFDIEQGVTMSGDELGELGD